MSFRNLDREWDEVVIVDLLSPQERRSWGISEALRSQLAAGGIHQLQISCARRNHVFEALELCVKRTKVKSFLLHFTAHGSKDGIGNNDQIGLILWHEIRPLLQAINSSFNGDLVVVLIACKGIYGLRLDDLQDATSPYYAVVGPTRDLSFDEASACTTDFYDQLMSDVEIPTIVANLNRKKGEDILWGVSSQARRGITLSVTS